jgi:hypothetical protein
MTRTVTIRMWNDPSLAGFRGVSLTIGAVRVIVPLLRHSAFVTAREAAP